MRWLWIMSCWLFSFEVFAAPPKQPLSRPQTQAPVPKTVSPSANTHRKKKPTQTSSSRKLTQQKKANGAARKNIHQKDRAMLREFALLRDMELLRSMQMLQHLELLRRMKSLGAIEKKGRLCLVGRDGKTHCTVSVGVQPPRGRKK